MTRLPFGPHVPAIICASGPVAQSVEQRIENPCVGGSIPPQATIFLIPVIQGFFLP